MLNLKGSISIKHPHFSDGRQLIHIELIDEKSACPAIEVHLGLADFADALTGRGLVECDFDFNNSGVIGMVYEHKEELVPIPEMLFRDDDKRIAEVLAPFEVDGWKGRTRDLVNHHCHSRKGTQNYASVVFTRHVPAKEGT
jgi:hypothetical protein